MPVERIESQTGKEGLVNCGTLKWQLTPERLHWFSVPFYEFVKFPDNYQAQTLTKFGPNVAESYYAEAHLGNPFFKNVKLHSKIEYRQLWVILVKMYAIYLIFML